MKTNKQLRRLCVKELLWYSPANGIFIWLQGPRRGKVAGCLDRDSGYIRIGIGGKLYYAHRLAFIYMGKPLPEEVDHINHFRADNRWGNLRASSKAGNAKNQKMRSTNKSGVTGVSHCPRTKKWISQIKINGKHVHLGYFQDIAEAIYAREEAAKNAGYHPNHGKDLL